MSVVNCMSNGCDSGATTQIVRVEGRRAVDQQMLCDKHARTFIEPYHPRSGKFKAAVVEFGDGRGIEFDVEALYSESPREDGYSNCHVFLLQTGGSIRISVQTGLCELAAVHRGLSNVQLPRPTIHHSMSTLIRDLGGRLDCVTLDKYVAAQRTYFATLHIHLDNRDLSLDVRTSDAIIVALICDSPILVSLDVLASMSGDANLR